jgi:stress response protein YsnF
MLRHWAILSDKEKSVPIMAEKYSVFKRKLTQNITIEKRWVTTTKTINIPIKYEEVYVNGKRLSQSGLSSLLSSLTNADKQSAIKISKAKNDNKPKIALDGKGAFQKILPLYGEQIRLTKRMVKYADAVITKSKVTENKQIRIELSGEKAMIRYPDGTTRTLESTAPAPSVADSMEAA